MTSVMLALWIITLSTALFGFLLSFFQYRPLTFPRSYLAYFAAAGLIQLVSIRIGYGQYWQIFWLLEVLNNILLCILAIEVVRRHLPAQYGFICFAVFAIIFVVVSYLHMPNIWETFLDLSVSASFLAGIWLCFLFFVTSITWTKEYRLVTAGVLSLLGADLCQFLVPHGHKMLSGMISEIGPLPGLILLSIAGDIRARRARAYSRSR